VKHSRYIKLLTVRIFWYECDYRKIWEKERRIL